MNQNYTCIGGSVFSADVWWWNLQSVCGDGRITGSEVCDDGSNDSWGCSSNCMYVLPYWQCNRYWDSYYSKNYSSCTFKCGDGYVLYEAGEVCDDDNEGKCWFDCLSPKPGYYCTEDSNRKSICESRCGDRIKTDDEICDEHPYNDHPYVPIGCKDDCSAENIGFICQTKYDFGFPFSYCKEDCDDGWRVGIETCDDGQDVNVCDSITCRG